MKRQRYHLTPHAQEETIPLRTGLILKSNKVYLDEITEDPYGTEQQTISQKERGNFHILANVWLSEVGVDRLPGRWRIVTNDPTESYQDPPILTILPEDRLTIRSEANLTDFLKKARMAGDKKWLTSEYIAKELHPMLKKGDIRNQNDLSNLIRGVELKPILSAKNAAEKAMELAQQEKNDEKSKRELADKHRSDALKEKELAEQKTFEALREKDIAESIALEALQEKDIADSMALDAMDKKNAAEIIATNSQKERDIALDRASKAESDLREAHKLLIEKSILINKAPSPDPMTQPAKPVTKSWPSKTGGPYTNIGIEATIVKVRNSGAKIFLTYLDKNCHEKTIYDFGYQGFVSSVFNYLKSKEGSRGIFLLTWKSDEEMRLASNTMMLPRYAGLWH